jgi:phospholipase A2
MKKLILGFLFLSTIALVQPQQESQIKPQEKVKEGKLSLIQKALFSALHLPQLTKIDPIFLRKGTDLCEEEKESIKIRQETTHKALQKLLNDPTLDKDSMPSIGIVSSGGGERAMISTIGLLAGLQQNGIVDCCQYISTLSGSTWAILSWIFHDISLLELGKFLRKNQITKKVNLTKQDYEATVHRLLEKMAYDQPISFGDLWGAFLTSLLFSDLPNRGHSLKISSIQGKILDGNYPMPIFTCIENDSGQFAEWIEVSPFEAGSKYFKAWCPLSAFGKKFVKGQTTDPAPEQSLGFFISVFGSAYAVTFHRILFEIYWQLKASLQARLDKLPLPKTITNNLSSFVLRNFDKFLNSDKSDFTKDIQFSPPEVRNLTYKMSGYPLEKSKFLQLFDAGIDFNLPFPPLMRRGVDVMIVCDASSNINDGPDHAMRGAMAYAKRKGYSFPQIDFTDIDKKRVNLFYDENDSRAPIIVYCPNLKPFPTLKFTYTDQEFKNLETFMRESGVQAKDTIIQAIKIAMQNKQANNSIDSNDLSKILDQLDEDYISKGM